MKKEQNRHSLHLIRQNVPQFILLVIFSVLLGVSVIAVSVLMKMFLDIATNASAMPLTTCLIIAVGVLLVLGISQVVTSVLQGKLSCRMELSLRSAMVEHLYRTDLRTFDSGAADNYFTRMTKDAETLSNFYSKTLISSIFFESFTFVVSFILMFLLEWKLAVVMIVVVPILIFTMIRISPKLEMNSIRIMQNEDKNRNILQEFLSQYMLFKSYGVLGWVQKRVGDTYAQKQKYVGKLSVLQGAIGFLNNFLGVGMFIIALGMGSFLVVRGETTVGTLIAVVNLVSFFYGPFLHISGWMAEVNEVKVSTNRIGEILSMPTENSTQTAKPAVQNAGSAALTAKDLSFAYDEEKVILSHAETQVHTGEIVALTGENGSGKSTLTKLLIGFYTPTGGEVELKIGNKTVHGAEIRNYLSYDSGFVSVFAGTLKENICMDQPFDEKKFRKAVDLANFTEFVNEKTAEYEIEPEGKNLSSGQRRKVALARIFYDDRPVFVLDEPTANLDKASAEGMFEALKQVCKDKICIIVTHDAFISEKCDRVLHLNNKKVTG